jgi:hypothetical protein
MLSRLSWFISVEEKKSLKRSTSDFVNINIQNEGRRALVTLGFIQLHASGCATYCLLREGEGCYVLLARGAESRRCIGHYLGYPYVSVSYLELKWSKISHKSLGLGRYSAWGYHLGARPFHSLALYCIVCRAVCEGCPLESVCGRAEHCYGINLLCDDRRERCYVVVYITSSYATCIAWCDGSSW